MKEILKICRLTEEEMEKYLKLTKYIDHKVDHGRAYRTMMNPTRRDLLKFISTNVKTFDQILNEFDLGADQIRYHLSMLEQLLYIMNTENGWKSTPRGIGFLHNAIMN